MTKNKKPVTGGTGTGFKTTFDSRYFTTTGEQLERWGSFTSNVKPSRNRRQKSSWNRGRKA